MVWQLAATLVGGQLVSGAIQDRSARKAAGMQQAAADRTAQEQRLAKGEATQAWNNAFDGSMRAQDDALGRFLPMQEQAYQQALQEQQASRERMFADAEPYRMAGTEALAKLRGLADFDPSPTAESVMAEPGYQFGLNQGRNSLEGSAAARGGLYSGNALKELTAFGNDYGTTKFNDAFNRQRTSFNDRWGRISGLANMGRDENARVSAGDQSFANNIGELALGNAQRQGSALLDAAGNQTALRTQRANAIGNLATGTANNLGNVWTSNANAQAASRLQRGNIWANGINQLSGMALNQFGGP